MLHEQALVLNKSWCMIKIVSVRKALGLICAGTAKAVCIESFETHDFGSWMTLKVKKDEKFIRTISSRIKVPEVIQLCFYDAIPPQGVTFSRKNIYKRDHYACQYCKKHLSSSELTVDHVIPRSRGGKSTWINCVTACVSCNKSKGNISLDKCGLELLREPFRPRWDFELDMASAKAKKSWQRFIKG